MKTFLYLLFFGLSIVVSAQIPQGIQYQGIARDPLQNLIVNQPIKVRFSIHDASASGTIVYRETHSVTTSALGLFNLVVGQGTALQGTFAGINWASGSKFLQVEIDPIGGNNFLDFGTQQMLSVPYALYSQSSADAPTFNAGTTFHSLSAPSGIQTIPHGLGRIPKKVKITAMEANSSGAGNYSVWNMSEGVYENGNNMCIFRGQNANVQFFVGTDNAIINLHCSNSIEYQAQRATATTDATNIYLNWINTGFPNGAAYIMWEVE